MVDWLGVLQWSEEQLNDLRAVGYSYLQQGLYERATVFFEGIVSIDKLNVGDNRTLGGLYLQRGDAKAALKTLDVVLKQAPRDAPSLLNRAKALFMLGRRAEGLALARMLTGVPEGAIRRLAQALVMAYS